MNTTIPAHTPTPWFYKPESQTRFDSFSGEKSETIRPWIRDDKNNCIALTANGESAYVDAAYIVKAVNNHEALREALENLLELLHHTDTSNNSTRTQVDLGSAETKAKEILKASQ
jgi:hypothetical protein